MPKNSTAAGDACSITKAGLIFITKREVESRRICSTLGEVATVESAGQLGVRGGVVGEGVCMGWPGELTGASVAVEFRMGSPEGCLF
jgi:hypothetical protein